MSHLHLIRRETVIVNTDELRRCIDNGLSYLSTQCYGHDVTLGVWQSAAGFYLGHWDSAGPVARDSEEYWGTREEAEQALKDKSWTQRIHP